MGTSTHNPRTHLLAWAGAGVLAAAICGAAPAQQAYEFQDLGTLGRDSEAMAIDDNGLVVGWSEMVREGRGVRSEYERHAFLWRSEMHDLGLLGGRWSEARDVNARAEVVGTAELADGRRHAFLYYGETMFDLNTLIGQTTLSFRPRLIEANAINDDTHIVACGYVGRGHELHGFLLVPMEEGQVIAPLFEVFNLGRLPDGDDCAAFGLNAFDEVVGRSGDQAFFWRDDVIGSLEPNFSRSQARALNDRGMAVGSVAGGDWESMVAVSWGVDRRLQLDTSRGWVSEAMAVNDNGRIVGWAAPIEAGPNSRDGEAMLWIDTVGYNLNAITDLPMVDAPVITLERANGIDNQGRIVGCWRKPDGSRNAFILRPTVNDTAD